MPPRRYLTMEANHHQLMASQPALAILPWGATEAHGYHLPYGTDVIEGREIASAAAAKADQAGARLVVLPTVPFGNDEQQLDQVATISIRTTTAFRILQDVVRSLASQGIRRLLVLNAHGGNEFKPMVRDVQKEFDVLVVVVNFYQLVPQVHAEIFDLPGDHADEMETSLLLHLCPELVEMEQAGTGERKAFAINLLQQSGVWTPRPWSRCQPDTGSGDPGQATAEKGRRYFEALTTALADLLVQLADLQNNLVEP